MDDQRMKHILNPNFQLEGVRIIDLNATMNLIKNNSSN